MEKETGVMAATIDRVVEDPEQRAQLKGELHLVQAAVKAEKSTVDAWLTRYIRPMALIFTAMLMVLAIGLRIGGAPLPSAMEESIFGLALIMFPMYIGGRSFEKAAGRFRRG